MVFLTPSSATKPLSCLNLLTPFTETIGFFTSHLDGEVILRSNKKGEGNEPPLTIHELVHETVTKFPDFIALGTRKTNEWETLTYIEYYELCRKAAKSFLKLGLERFHGVGILGYNCIEWLIADIASIFAGGISVGIFPSNSSQTCRFIAENSEANIFMVEDDWQLQKILKIQDHLRHLKAIVQYKDKLTKKIPNIYSVCMSHKGARGQRWEDSYLKYRWEEFLALGLTISDETLDRIIDSQKPNQCCMLVYTSGTTGSPKAVMISHDNITWTAAAVLQSLPYTYPPENQEILVSYLPLCLITVQIFEVWIPLTTGASIFFADSDALKVQGSLINTLREVRPTTFLGTPAVWEEIQEKLKSDQMSATPWKKTVIDWARKVGLKTNLRRDDERTYAPVGYRVAKKLIYEKVRRILGLDRCLQFLTTGSGLSREIQEFFMSYDITLLPMYGMTECTGLHSVSSERDYKLFSFGKAIVGAKSRLRNEDREGLGEFYLWGRHLSMGYLNNEYKTKKAFDQKGWLHTGDMGFLDNEGYHEITGRIEEVIITNRGEKIFPVPIENMLKDNIPIVHYAMIVGNQARFLSVLLTLKCEISEDTGEPRNVLTQDAIHFCRKNNSKSTKVTDIINNQDPIIDAIIQKAIDAINEKTELESHKILKWKILEKDFSIMGGELGPTSKLRRLQVSRMYQTIISDFSI
ncbi:LOW QUALITY PROTEIN: long-chain-fatty-acid--CoA ligase ACSBG2-like [Dromiciops gliroides]|uniref:LOW QUALITY PROTEIN: long-chain-fatty-acid--CoA ligase ACSBG2-like n=1 Tax=Dromiciops gliroides TaxID=33562 RepID=UPI001CC70ECB|nr:LOW QUALITY PROTEIN: long-chain-fatty-acid--CoA ligase ACSBG2-like [Dromiciops gliroides]